MQSVSTTSLQEDVIAAGQEIAAHISLEEIEMRESAISSDTVYCCIIHGTF